MIVNERRTMRFITPIINNQSLPTDGRRTRRPTSINLFDRISARVAEKS